MSGGAKLRYQVSLKDVTREMSSVRVQAEAPSDSDDEDEFVYNPLKLPLGYDGKPIPYWLYKLHGLNQVLPPSVSSK